MGNETLSPPSKPNANLEQWVHKVNGYSTQYSPGNWSANQIIGRPKVYPHYGDNVGAWTPSSYNVEREYIDLEFEKNVLPTELHIYITFNPNPITKIYFKCRGKWDIVHSRTQREIPMNRTSIIFKPELEMKKLYTTNEVRIEYCSTGWSYYPEIDCVKLVGMRKIIGDCQPSNELSELGKRNLGYLENGEFSDFILTVNKKEIKVHKSILSTRNKHFEKYFDKEEFEDEKLSLDKYLTNISFPEETLMLFLKYLYCDFVKIEPKFLFPCYKIARKFGSTEFENYVLGYFKSFIDDDTSIKVFRKCKRNEKFYKKILDLCYFHFARNLEFLKFHNTQAYDALDKEDLKIVEEFRIKLKKMMEGVKKKEAKE